MRRRKSDVTSFIDQLKPIIDQLPNWNFESLLALVTPILGRPTYLSRAELPRGCTAGAMATATFYLIMIDVAAAGQYKDLICSHELAHIMLGHLTQTNVMSFGSFLPSAEVTRGDEATPDVSASCPFTGAIEGAAELFATQLVTYIHNRPHLHNPGRGGRLATILE